MAFDRDAILAQIEQDKDRFLTLVNGTATDTVVLESRTVKSIQGQLDDAIGTQIAQADSILVQTQDLRDATAVDTQTASTSAVAAATSETNAAGSATAAAASETAAGISETNAAGSAAAAATSEGNAATSAAGAASSASAALTSEQNALATWEAFQGRYWGAYASEPALDPLGAAATLGDLYFNTTNGFLHIFEGTVWTAVSNYVPRTATTGSAQLPVGTEAQRDGVPAAGMIRFNSDIGLFEGFNGISWTPVGAGATGGAGDQVFVENDQVVTANYTIPADKNAASVGPITVNAGVTVTVSGGARWLIH